MSAPVKHRAATAGGALGLGIAMGVAICGARRKDGAEFASQTRLVTCPVCVAFVKKMRTEAKERLAAL